MEFCAYSVDDRDVAMGDAQQGRLFRYLCSINRLLFFINCCSALYKIERGYM